MKKVNVTLRVDEDLKKQADALFSELGLNMTTAFNIFLRQAVREQQIPFRVTRNSPNAVTLAVMDASDKGEDLVVLMTAFPIRWMHLIIKVEFTGQFKKDNKSVINEA